MPLEAASFLNDLNASNPPGSDQLKQADDHLRLVKAVLKASFPNISAARYLEQPRVDVADAATPALWAATSDYCNLLGTTTITGFASGADGQMKLVRFPTVRTLTHNSTLLELPGGANITTEAGDHAIVRCLGTTLNKVVAYTRMSTKPPIAADLVPDIAAGDVGNFLQATDDSPKTRAWGFPIPAGVVLAWAAASPPSGWLECDGSSQLRATYPNLFSAIGTIYGAADGTHFNLPDYRGEFLRGMDPGTTRDPDSASRTDRGDGTGGANVGTKQGHQYQSHTHTYDQPIQANSPTGSGASRIEASTPGTATGPSGGNETRPRNVNVKWIIKAH